jgi:hypothetical protein
MNADQSTSRLQIETGERSFVIEREPTQLADGWVLRERYGNGWPVMGGPYRTAVEAMDFIDELLAAEPLCDYEDEHGYQSCDIGSAPGQTLRAFGNLEGFAARRHGAAGR